VKLVGSRQTDPRPKGEHGKLVNVEDWQERATMDRRRALGSKGAKVHQRGWEERRERAVGGLRKLGYPGWVQGRKSCRRLGEELVARGKRILRAYFVGEGRSPLP